MLSRLVSLLQRRPVRIALSIALSAVLGGLLIVTIHYTRVDLQWLAFLGGVLFAAVLALVSQASKAEWLLLRRTRQIERVREQLNEEIARGRNSAQALLAAEARMRHLSDHLPFPLFYFDRNGNCRYHNRACGEWLALPAGRIDDEPLQEIFGSAVYASIASQIEQTLAGAAVDYELACPGRDGVPAVFRARQVPYAPNAGRVAGFYLVLSRAPAGTAAGSPQAATVDGAEALYLDAISAQLMTEANPRARIEQALRQNEFLLLAQKILPLRSGMPEPDCYEILLRLREEEDHLLPPGGFIPVAERYGMLEKIDRWVVRTLIAWSLDNRQRFPGSRIPMFCVNLSAASVCNREFPQFVCELLGKRDFPARALCLEVSQPDLINFNDAARQFISGLGPEGCRFSVDDFGSAKVTFSPLRGIALDYLKIDGSIVQSIGRDAAELAKARAIHTVCQKAGMRTIAESVETRQTLDTLRGIGIDYVQGFGIARPAPIEQVFPASRPGSAGVSS